MKSAALDREISIGFSKKTTGPGGTPSLDLFEALLPRAELVEEAMTETPAGAGKLIEQTATFKTRFVTIDPRHVLQYCGHIYEIVGVSEIGRRKGLELRCKRRAS